VAGANDGPAQTERSPGSPKREGAHRRLILNASDPHPAVFLDRDGTVNVEKNYLYRIEDLEWIDGSVEAIRLLNLSRFRVIVVTNQSGIARGFYNAEDVHRLHDQMQSILTQSHARIDAFLYCPHHPEGEVEAFRQSCECRKPGTGMIDRARKLFPIDLSRSWVVGDSAVNMEMATRAGIRKILVRTGNGENTAASRLDLQIEYVAKNLYDATIWLTGNRS